MDTIVERVARLEAEGIFLGGPSRTFVQAGQRQLITLLSQGLNTDSKVLDIGCGCLRGGYWLIHFLDEGCYFGIEPNTSMLEAGTRILLEPGLAELKRPSFNHNPDFDFAVFGETFDFYMARSIWTHASRRQIESMLDGFVATSNKQSLFLTSYIRASLLTQGYDGEAWVGKSHESSTPGMVRHSLRWIRRACEARGLSTVEISERAYNFGRQTWIAITHKTSRRETE